MSSFYWKCFFDAYLTVHLEIVSKRQWRDEFYLVLLTESFTISKSHILDVSLSRLTKGTLPPYYITFFSESLEQNAGSIVEAP